MQRGTVLFIFVTGLVVFGLFPAFFLVLCYRLFAVRLVPQHKILLSFPPCLAFICFFVFFSPSFLRCCLGVIAASVGSDACAGRPCAQIGAVCNVTRGVAVCTCMPGFVGDGQVCLNLDECNVGTHTCVSRGAMCTDTPGSFACTCLPGYNGDGIVCVPRA
jgi:hypothetical protein